MTKKKKIYFFREIESMNISFNFTKKKDVNFNKNVKKQKIIMTFNFTEKMYT